MKKDTFEELVVVKRSGQRVNFNNYKIAVAIKNAFDNEGSNYDEKNINKVYEDVLKFIEINYQNRKTINVEDIQDIIENKLKDFKYEKVFRAFNEYRAKRALSRKAFTIKAQHKFVKAIEKIASDNSLTEDYLKPNEILLKYGKTVVSGLTESYLVDNKFLRAHAEGNIYINDLENFPLGIIRGAHPNFKNYLEIKNSINNVTAEIINLQSEVGESINIPGLDYFFEGWLVRQYKYYYREFIINYAKITGFDKYLNLKKIMDLIDREVIITPKTHDFKAFILNDQTQRIFNLAYQDTINKITEILEWKLQKLITNLQTMKTKISISFGTNDSFAGTLINQSLLEVIEALPAFQSPTIIFKIKAGISEKYYEKVIDLIVKGKKIAIAFTENSYNKANHEVEYFADGIRIFENINTNTKTSIGRMVISETAINMSRLALKYHGQPIKEFYQELDEVLELVKNELLLAFEMIGNKNKNNYSVLFNDNILDDEKLDNQGKIRKVIKNGNLNIALVGLKECAILLAKNETKELVIVNELLNYLNKKCREFTNETKLNFVLCEPDDQEVRKELMALDKAIYGEIKNITNKNCYELISDLSSLKDDYGALGKIQKLFNGGNKLKIVLPKSVTDKKIKNIFKELISADIGFVTFEQKEGS